MPDKSHEKVIRLTATKVFEAEDHKDILGDLGIYIYPDGSVLFVGSSILETKQFIKILSNIDKYLEKTMENLEK